MCAACRRGRVEPHRGLDAAEEFQPKLLLLLNSQMFVQGFDSENGPAILLMLLNSQNRQRFVQGVDAGTWVIAGPVSASNGLRIAEKSMSLSSFFKVACSKINSFLYSSLVSSRSLEFAVKTSMSQG